MFFFLSWLSFPVLFPNQLLYLIEKAAVSSNFYLFEFLFAIQLFLFFSNYCLYLWLESLQWSWRLFVISNSSIMSLCGTKDFSCKLSCNTSLLIVKPLSIELSPCDKTIRQISLHIPYLTVTILTCKISCQKNVQTILSQKEEKILELFFML